MQICTSWDRTSSECASWPQSMCLFYLDGKYNIRVILFLKSQHKHSSINYHMFTKHLLCVSFIREFVPLESSEPTDVKKNAIGIKKTRVGPDILELSKSTVFPQDRCRET